MTNSQSPDRAALADELLPCPFCGPEGNPNLHECDVGPLNGGRHVWFCKCTTCDIELDFSDTAQAAVVRWNTRSPSPYSGADEIIDAKSLLDCMNGYLTVHARKDGTFEIRGGEKAADAIRLVVRHNTTRVHPTLPRDADTVKEPYADFNGDLTNPAERPTLPRDAERQTIERCISVVRFCGECDCPRMTVDAMRALPHSGAGSIQHGADYLQTELDKLGAHVTYTACKAIVAGLYSPLVAGWMECSRCNDLEVQLAKSCDDGRFEDSDAGCTRAIIAEAETRRLREALANCLGCIPPREGPVQSTTEQADRYCDHLISEIADAMWRVNKESVGLRFTELLKEMARVAIKIVQADASRDHPVREALAKIATMPLSMEFERDERGEIKHGARSYGPAWAAWHFQELAKSALSPTSVMPDEGK